MERHPRALDGRSLLICLYCMAIAAAVAVIARLLVLLIGLITNLAFYGRLATDLASPAGNTLGLWVIAIPVAGSLVIGVMARYGAKAIRGTAFRRRWNRF